MITATTHIITEKQLVPELRFKEFSGEWDEILLDDFAQRGSGHTPSKSHPEYYNGSINWISLTDSKRLDKGFIDETNTKITQEGIDNSSAVLHPAGTVLLSRDAGVGKSAVMKHSMAVSQHFIVWKSVEGKSSNWFLYNWLQIMKPHFELIAVGNTIKTIGLPYFKKLKIVNPTLPEQQKIASFLSAVDEKIQQLTKKKALLEQYKKGVMQQLFSGQLRFKDENGKDYPDWKPRKMSEVLFEHKLNSTGKEEVFSVSVHKGLVNQVEHLGRVFAAKNTNNYNLVQPDDIVYTKSPTGSFPLGIIKQSKIDKNVIVSPLYGIFTPETEGLGYMFNVFFESPINVKNYLASIIQKGAKNTINITNTTFLSKKMKLPVSKEEQNRIGDFLKEIDTKISITKNQITQTQTFKKGLLQQMFV
ncbi:MAG: type I restriction enzyme S subunit [Patiriisocius sp.]|jgi:type I restriction enzyme S subunit